MYPPITAEHIRELLTTMDGLFYIVQVVVPVFMLFVTCFIKVAIFLILVRVAQVLAAIAKYIKAKAHAQ